MARSMDDEINDGKVLLGERPPLAYTTTTLVCLNFKVPLRVRQLFKIYAARHNMTMTEMLLRLLDDCLTSDSDRSQPTRSQTKE